MDKKNYQRQSFNPKNKWIQLSIGDMFITFLKWLIIIYVFLVWRNMIPRVNEQLILDSDYNATIDGVTMKYNSKQLQQFDNVLIASQGETKEQIRHEDGILQLSSHLVDIQICNSTAHNLTCASIEQINELLSEPIEIEITILTSHFNIKERSYYTLPRKIILYIHKNSQQLVQITLHKTHFEVDSNIFFENPDQIKEISDSSVLISSINMASYTLAHLNLQIDPVIKKTVVVYDKLYALLLQFVTVFYIFQCLELLLKWLNGIRQEKVELLKIISIYFPQLNEYKFRFNIFGKLVDLQTFDNEKRNAKLMNQFLERYYEAARNKMKIKNIIYALSRLQFICQSLQDRDTMMNVHGIGIKLNLQQEIENSLTTETIEIDDPLILRGSDFELLSRQNVLMGVCNNPFYRKNQRDMKGKFCMI